MGYSLDGLHQNKTAPADINSCVPNILVLNWFWYFDVTQDRGILPRKTLLLKDQERVFTSLSYIFKSRVFDAALSQNITFFLSGSQG